MKTLQILMLLMLPVWTLAHAKIITFTTTPMIEDGKDISILIAFVNSSTNTIQVPMVGGSDRNGYPMPADEITYSGDIYALVDKEPCWIGGMGMGVIHGSDTTQPLLPHEKITYRASWDSSIFIDYLPDETEMAMFVFEPRFDSFEFKIPSITLYYNKSNQGVDPTSANAQSVVPEG